MPLKTALRLSCLALLLAAGARGATVYLVQPDGSGDFPNIARAMEVAISGDVIELGDGTYTGDGNRDLDMLGKALTLRSRSGDPSRCVIDAEAFSGNYHRVIAFRSGESVAARIEGITLRNGFLGDAGAQQRGGAVLLENASASFLNCVIEGSRARLGGGVHCVNSSPVFRDCVFRSNTAAWQGGGLSAEASSLVVENCVFEDDRAEFGGAVACLGSEAMFSGCLIYRNAATGKGGGLYTGNASTVTMSASTLMLNDAPVGSSISLVLNTSLDLDHSIVGFGIASAAVDLLFGSTMRISCTDIFGHAYGDWTGDIAGQLGVDGNISADPLFCNVAGNHYGLQAGSPCTEANSACGLMGALPESCAIVRGISDAASWSLVKGLYRPGR